MPQEETALEEAYNDVTKVGSQYDKDEIKDYYDLINNNLDANDINVKESLDNGIAVINTIVDKKLSMGDSNFYIADHIEDPTYAGLVENVERASLSVVKAYQTQDPSYEAKKADYINYVTQYMQIRNNLPSNIDFINLSLILSTSYQAGFNDWDYAQGLNGDYYWKKYTVIKDEKRQAFLPVEGKFEKFAYYNSETKKYTEYDARKLDQIGTEDGIRADVANERQTKMLNMYMLATQNSMAQCTEAPKVLGK